MRRLTLLPINLQQWRNRSSNSLLPYPKAHACLHPNPDQSNEHRARNPTRLAYQSRLRTFPRRRENAALSCSMHAYLYPYPFPSHLGDLLPTKPFSLCTWRSSTGSPWLCTTFTIVLPTNLLAYSVLISFLYLFRWSYLPHGYGIDVCISRKSPPRQDVRIQRLRCRRAHGALPLVVWPG
jgi:hypothetical protein